MTPVAHEYPMTILEHHLDTFGHVNNAMYLQLFETARWQWITDGGDGFDTVRKTQQGPTVLECTVKFQRELTNRHSVVIHTRLDDYTGKIGRVNQDIVRSDGEVCCQARFTLALFDLKARRLIAPTDAWLASIGAAPTNRS